ncbi:hypothetical protein I552_3769 [Mycobacterium xenopi 3993]|nr:hypothetical protein I552_3769 [Mycobacterium xenopi 3993]
MSHDTAGLLVQVMGFGADVAAVPCSNGFVGGLQASQRRVTILL